MSVVDRVVTPLGLIELSAEVGIEVEACVVGTRDSEDAFEGCDGVVGEEKERRGVRDAVELMLAFPGTRNSGKFRACGRNCALAEIASKHMV